MALESATYIGDLNAANPTSTDPKKQGDDHLRLVKSVLKNSFAGITGAVTVTHTDLNSVTGKANKSGDTYSGTHNFAGATINVPTQTAGDSSTKAASTAFVAATAFASSLPAQAGGVQKEIVTDGTNASWGYLNKRSARTSNTMLGVTDNRKLIDITSGTFTQTFDAAATLGDGWSCRIRNGGTGDITLDPNGSETIDGLTSFVMYPGEIRDILCDGTALYSVVVAGFYKAFTSVGVSTFVKPPGYRLFSGLAWNGGSSGARTGSASTTSSGGGGGGCAPFTLPASLVGATETVTVGAGGAAVTSVTAFGNVGGNTSFGSLVTVYANSNFYAGGSISQGLVTAYASSNVRASGFEGGTLVIGLTDGGNDAVWGGAGSVNFQTRTIPGSSIYGAGAGGSCNGGSPPSGTVGGSSVFAGQGGASNSTSNGTDGTAPGGGGGATQTGAQSGAGARGELRIWGII